ncbi:MAG: lipase maturation factor family protein [Verrucomicrobia bacterium]|nr:lipase maturation factor family protein [Verrucomicrobiota bacterium]
MCDRQNEKLKHPHSPTRLVHTAAPAEKPLFIYDGECEFCIRWVRRSQESTRPKVDFASFQSVGERFAHDVPIECFRLAVHLIETDGSVYRGAEAVFRMLSYGSRIGSGFGLWCYQQVPGFASAARFGYRLVAGHREIASALTKTLWGRDEYAVCRPTYYIARTLFLRLLGLVYLIAFWSFWSQVDGLIGPDGVLPVAPWLAELRNRFGPEAYRLFPTLCWFNAGTSFLHSLCAAGVALSLMLMLQIAPLLCLVVLWALYLSLSVAGQVFMNFQWDYLLLEAGFFSIFLAPFRLIPSRRYQSPISPWAYFLLRWLLFRLMFMSGLVKLTSGDESWWNLTALRYHYETQPLPTPLSWWAHQFPPWFQAFSTVVMFAIELGAPFLLFAPRRMRVTGVFSLLTLQVLIALTGNYCFFNLLTAALCLLSLDDAVWPRKARLVQQTKKLRRGTWPSAILVPLVAVVLTISGPLLWNAFLPDADWPPLLGGWYAYLEPFRSLNGYGLFRVMTKTRPEILVEGSQDGVTWKPYEFKYKAGDPQRAPAIVAPHQPRLDWQMWFAALDDFRGEPWFMNFLARLLQGSPSVLGLMKTNPFPGSPPRYIRARLFEYHFTNQLEKKQTGAWWRQKEEGIYCPPVSIRSEE